MKTINELQDEVIEEFSDFDDWMDKYQLLIDLGNEQEPLDEKYKTEQNLIDGCQSRVWLQADLVDGKIVFQAESDALIVKGIIALLIKVLSGHTPDEILNSDLYFIDKIGLKEHLFGYGEANTDVRFSIQGERSVNAMKNEAACIGHRSRMHRLSNPYVLAIAAVCVILHTLSRPFPLLLRWWQKDKYPLLLSPSAFSSIPPRKKGNYVP